MMLLKLDYEERHKEGASPSKRVGPGVLNSALLSALALPQPVPSESFSKESAGIHVNEREIGEATPQKWKQKKTVSSSY